MTETVPPLTLDQLYDVTLGEAFEGIPEPGGFIDLPQQALSDHPFMWALDVFVFAGPEAHLATTRYAQGQAVSQLNIHAYRILSTTSGVMHLMRVL